MAAAAGNSWLPPARGLNAQGGEFSAAAAANAAARIGAPVFDLSQPDWRARRWDCIRLGDVIEHLPAPRETLREIVAVLPSGGWLAAEGPLEANASLVNAAARGLGWLKARAGHATGGFAPYHLIFTTAAGQRALFDRLGVPLTPVDWQIGENGWPYRGNGVWRDAIGRAAIALGHAPLAHGRLGNRFRALFRRA